MNKNASMLNEEYTKKIQELVHHAKEACEIYESLPEALKHNKDKDVALRSALAESSNLTHQVAWSFSIDTTK